MKQPAVKPYAARLHDVLQCLTIGELQFSEKDVHEDHFHVSHTVAHAAHVAAGCNAAGPLLQKFVGTMASSTSELSDGVQWKHYGKRYREKTSEEAESLHSRGSTLDSSLQSHTRPSPQSARQMLLTIEHPHQQPVISHLPIQARASRMTVLGNPRRPIALSAANCSAVDRPSAAETSPPARKFKGVSETPRNGKFECRVYLGRVSDPTDPSKRKVVNHYVGRYASAEEAAYQHDVAAVEHGISNKNRLNFPELFVRGVGWELATSPPDQAARSDYARSADLHPPLAL